MSAKKEHWATRLKRELAEARADVRELALHPDSFRSNMIRGRLQLEDRMLKVFWFGDYKGGRNAAGITNQMTDGRATTEP